MTHTGVHADIAALRAFALAIETGPERNWRSRSGELATQLAPEASRAFGTTKHHPRMAAIGDAQQANIAAHAAQLGQIADALETLREYASQLHTRYRDTDDAQAQIASELGTELNAITRGD